jgi:hypothetical protein
MDVAFQDVAVSLAALAAAVSLVWRLAGLVRPQRQATPGCSGCASCPSSPREAAVMIRRQPPV